MEGWDLRALAVLERLNAAGHRAVLVGGCVRDRLMGRTPHDYDAATSARPEQIREACAPMRVVETGVRHGTVTVLSGGLPVEVTTFRREGRYTDHRRPDRVEVTGDLGEDLARRDFTINAMAWEPSGLTDPFGGRADLAAGVIRCVGEPERRFGEDALRLLRALRFAAQLDFRLEEGTAAGVRACAPQLACVSRERGAEAVATGHYVRRERDGATGRCLLKKALHPEKDQSYVLYSLTQEQLSRSRFPLGGLSKEEIRAIAARQGFGNAEKKESQDICFIPDGDYAAFLRRYMGREYPPGPFLDQNGRRLGTHEGIVSYTVGQRRGLGISSEGRLYVKELRPEDNAVVLSDNAALFTRVLTADRLNLIPTDSLSAPIRAKARIRYRQQEQPCTIEQTGPDTVRVEFDQPQRAVTPGQAVVFYDGDLVIGGATIQKGRES